MHVDEWSASAREKIRARRLEIESSMPRWPLVRGFLADGTDAGPGSTKAMLIQKPHNVVEARQVSHEALEPHAVNCVLESLDDEWLGKVVAQRKC